MAGTGSAPSAVVARGVRCHTAEDFVMGNTGNLAIDWKTTTLAVGYRSYMFETVNNTAIEDAEKITPENLHEWVNVSKSSIVDFECKVCTSYEDLTTKLSASAQAEGAVMGAQVSGSASFLYDAKYVSNELYLVATVNVQYETTSLKPGKLKIKHDARSLSPSAFVDKYGDYYVGSYLTGGRLVLIVTATYDDRQQKIDSGVTIKGKLDGSGGGSAQFSSAFGQLSGAKRTNIKGYYAGGATPTKEDLETPENALKYIMGYSNTVKDNPSVFLAGLWKYGDVEGSPDGLNRFMVPISIDVESLSDATQQYKDELGNATYMLAECQKTDAPASVIAKLQDDIIPGVGRDVLTVSKAWLLGYPPKHAGEPEYIPNYNKLEKQGLVKPPSYYQAQLDALGANITKRMYFGDRIHVTWTSDRKLTHACAMDYESPQLTDEAVAHMLVDPSGKGGQVLNNTVIQIRSTEAKLGSACWISGSKMHEHLVYADIWSGSDLQKQQWIIRKVGSGDDDRSPLAYTDQVLLISTYSSWKDQRITRYEDHDRQGRKVELLTTKEHTDPTTDPWTLSRAPAI
jgi:hypothetical protein